MQYVQVVLTDDHVRLLREGLRNIIEPPGVDAAVFEPRVRQLEVFLDQVMEHPEAFPVTGRMATAIKHRTRLLKGPAETPSRRNKRKARQIKRQSAQRHRRENNKEYRRQLAAALLAIRGDLEEAEAAQEEAA